jgi:hypothetical protein
MSGWKRARHSEMPKRMRLEVKYSYLDDSVDEGKALEDAQQDDSEMEVYSYYLDWSVEEGQK